MILTLPFPPSTNGLFTNRRGGRAATKRYLAWQEEAGIALNQQGRFHREGPVALTIILGKPDNRHRDIDNYLKAPIDLLVKHGVINDDRNVHKIETWWGDVPDTVTLIVTEA